MDGIDFSAADLRALADRIERLEGQRPEEPPMNGLKWKAEEDVELIRLVGCGLRPVDMQFTFRRTKIAIQRRMRVLNLRVAEAKPQVVSPFPKNCKTFAVIAKSDRDACTFHLIDLRRSYDVQQHEPTAKGIALYRAKNEIKNPPCSNTPLVSNPSRFRGSAEGSQAAMCADA